MAEGAATEKCRIRRQQVVTALEVTRVEVEVPRVLDDASVLQCLGNGLGGGAPRDGHAHRWSLGPVGKWGFTKLLKPAVEGKGRAAKAQRHQHRGHQQGLGQFGHA